MLVLIKKLLALKSLSCKPMLRNILYKNVLYLDLSKLILITYSYELFGFRICYHLSDLLLGKIQ